MRIYVRASDWQMRICSEQTHLRRGSTASAMLFFLSSISPAGMHVFALDSNVYFRILSLFVLDASFAPKPFILFRFFLCFRRRMCVTRFFVLSLSSVSLMEKWYMFVPRIGFRYVSHWNHSFSGSYKIRIEMDFQRSIWRFFSTKSEYIFSHLVSWSVGVHAAELMAFLLLRRTVNVKICNCIRAREMEFPWRARSQSQRIYLIFLFVWNCDSVYAIQRRSSTNVWPVEGLFL